MLSVQARGATTDTTAVSPARALEKGKGTPKEIVALKEGEFYVNPFCSLLAQWTRGESDYARPGPRAGPLSLKVWQLQRTVLDMREGTPIRTFCTCSSALENGRSM